MTLRGKALIKGTYDFQKMTEDEWADVDWSVAYDNLAKALRALLAPSQAFEPVEGTWCPECGHGVQVDEEGLCVSCGATAIGNGANRALAALRSLQVGPGLKRALKALCDLEWSSQVSGSDETLCCPICGGTTIDGHAETCEMKSGIAALRAAPAEGESGQGGKM
jgi:hypothetical protein